MGEVVVLAGYTKLDIPVERVLDGAKHLERVLVLGWTNDGEFWAASSHGGDGTKTADLAQRFIHKFYAGDYS
jgi:hypothetical protein